MIFVGQQNVRLENWPSRGKHRGRKGFFFTVSDKHLNYISKLNDRLKKRIIWTRSLIWGRNARLRVAFISFSTKFSSPKEVEVDISVL